MVEKLGENMIVVEFERIAGNQVLISKETLDKLIQIIRQVDEIVISEASGKHGTRRGSLHGVWEGSQIRDDLLLEARQSLFNYEEK